MMQLQSTHPHVYRDYLSGLHVHRNKRLWAGLSTDQVIEQVLMRSLKTNEGLTTGRGMSEQQRHIWVQSTPACAEINRVMQELTDVQRNYSEQNKDQINTRQERDMKDAFTVLSVMAERNLFSPEASLRNIMNDVNACSAINVDSAKAIGKRILLSVVGQAAENYTFKRNAQAVTLGSKSSVRIDGEMVQIDRQLLFQRLVLAWSSSEYLESIFAFELCSYPTVLFHSPCHYASRKSQPLQTLYGPSFLLMPLQGQQDMCSMCWMGEPYSTEFHGHVEPQRIRTYAICLASIFQKSMGKLLWSSMDTTECLLRAWRSSGEPRGRSVLLWPSANMKVTLKKGRVSVKFKRQAAADKFIQPSFTEEQLHNTPRRWRRWSSDCQVDSYWVCSKEDHCSCRWRYRSTCATVPLHRSGWPWSLFPARA